MGDEEMSLLKWHSARLCDRNGGVSVKVQHREGNWCSPSCAVATPTTPIDVDAAVAVAVVVDAVGVVGTWKLSIAVDWGWKCCCCHWLMNDYFLCPIERRVRTVHFSDDGDAAVAAATGESAAVVAADDVVDDTDVD